MFMLMMSSNFINRSLRGASGGVITVCVQGDYYEHVSALRWSASCVVEL